MNIRYDKIPQVFIERYGDRIADWLRWDGAEFVQLSLPLVSLPRLTDIPDSVLVSDCVQMDLVRLRMTPRYAVVDPWYNPDRRRVVEATVSPASDADLDTIIHHSLLLRAEEHPL